jgi:hypothetical protein
MVNVGFFLHSRLPAKGEHMDLSFQEKSLWLLAIGLIAVFGLYFASVLPPESTRVLPHQVVRFGLLVILLVAFQVVAHVIMAIADRRSRVRGKYHADERDNTIELSGTRNGAIVLAAGVFSSICIALVTEGNFFFTHALLAFWVLAQLVEIGSRLFLYRRGA